MPAAPLQLVIEDRDGAKQVVLFSGEEITLGRAEQGNTVRLRERDVSRRHVRFSQVNGSVWVEDLGSSNGTRVNGERIQGKRRIREGDLVQIGDYDIAVLGATGVTEAPARGEPVKGSTQPLPAAAEARAPAGEAIAPAPSQNRRPRPGGMGRRAGALVAIGAVSLFLGWAAGRLLRPMAHVGATAESRSR